VKDLSEHRVETERLVLRRLTEDDIDDYYRLFTDPEVTRYLPTRGEPIPRESFDGAVERGALHWGTHGYGIWVVCEPDTGTLIGQCGLRFLEDIGETEVLYAFARRTWGLGYATEASRAALKWGFGRGLLDHVVAFAVPENAASTRVMEKLGMTVEGPVRIFGLDTVRYAITAERWNGLHADS
jgi:[ribosomal protein S5]-alanine N-acetyltransferase